MTKQDTEELMYAFLFSSLDYCDAFYKIEKSAAVDHRTYCTGSTISKKDLKYQYWSLLL